MQIERHHGRNRCRSRFANATEIAGRGRTKRSIFNAVNRSTRTLSSLLVAAAIGLHMGGRQADPAAASTQPTDDFVQWAEPPGPPTDRELDLIRKIDEDLKSGKVDVSKVLCDPELMALHAQPVFRKLIQRSAAVGPLSICGNAEPGIRMTLTIEVVDGQEKPAAGALVYIYHTSAKGWYADKGAHIRANSGDINHARLFGYGRTDEQGRLEIHTIRPAGYPRSELPAHYHVSITRDEQTAGGEIQFDDDPRLTPERRRRSLGERSIIVKPEVIGEHEQRCSARFTLEE